MLLPFLLVFALGLTNQKEKLQTDELLESSSDDIKKIINSLSIGISITKDVFDDNPFSITTQGLIKKDDVVCFNDAINEMIKFASKNIEPHNSCHLVDSQYDNKVFL